MKKTGMVLTILFAFMAFLLNVSGAAAADGYYQLTEVSQPAWDGTTANRLDPAAIDYDYTYGDDESVSFNLPWNMTFYGQNYSHITADTNGNIWFSATDSAYNVNLSTTGRGSVIAAWNNDLSSSFHGGVFIQHKTSPERVVIEWQAETYTEGGLNAPNNFAVVLYPDGSIRFDYKAFTTQNGIDTGSGISRGDGSAATDLTAQFGNVFNLAGRSFQFTPQSLFTITIAKDGLGGGTITSSPPGITCGTTCSGNFAQGTTVVLTATPVFGSDFGSWSGACSGTAPCTLNLDSSKSVTAAFAETYAPAVVISSPSGTIVNNRPTLNYAVSTGTVVVKVDGVVVNKVSGDTLDTLADGPHIVRVEAINAAGHLGFAESSFTVDTTPPVVAAITPSDGSVDVPVRTPILVQFSKPINPASILPGMVTLVEDGVTPVPGNFSIAPDAKSLVFTPTVKYDYNSRFTFTVKAGVLDSMGNAQLTDQSVSFSTPPISGASANIMGYWPMDGDWKDYSGGTNDGHVYGSSTFVPGRVPGRTAANFVVDSKAFAGSGGYVSTPYLYGVIDSFAMSFWAKPTETRNHTTETSAWQCLGTDNQRFAIGPFDVHAWNPNIVGSTAGVSVGTNGISVFENTTISGSICYFPSLLVYDAPAPLTDWNHIVVVYDNKTPKLYLNGVLVRTGVTSQEPYVLASTRFAYDNTRTTGSYGGQMSEVIYYDNLLSATEVQALYQTQTKVLPTLTLTSPGEATKYVPGATGTATVSVDSAVGITKLYCGTAGSAVDGLLAVYFETPQLQTTQSLTFTVLPDSAPYAALPITCAAQTVDGTIGAVELDLIVADVVLPTVTSSTPSNNAIDISASLPITVNFSEAMLASSFIPGATFKLQRADNGNLIDVQYHLSTDLKSLILIPSSALEAATAYTVTVNQLQDLAGNYLDPATVVHFTTLQQLSLSVTAQGTAAIPYVLAPGRYGTLALTNSVITVAGGVTVESLSLNNSTLITTSGALGDPGNLNVVNGDVNLTANSHLIVSGTATLSANLNATGSTVSISGVGSVGGGISLDDSTLTLKTNLMAAGDISLLNNSLLTHESATITATYKVDVTATNMSIDATSRVDVGGRGYLGGHQGNNTTASSRTNGNVIVGTETSRNGGSYGGLGGYLEGPRNAAYGDLTNPNESGGGGNGYCAHTADIESVTCDANYSGGNGGGLIRLKLNTLTLNGTITANGDGAISAGGSGGGIKIDATTISGTGHIRSNGGSSSGAHWTNGGGGGGGGGGRIALLYTTLTLPTANVEAVGGAKSYAAASYMIGGAGTIYLKASSKIQPSIIIDNHGVISSNETPIPALDYDGFEIINGARIAVNGNLNFAQDLTLTDAFWKIAGSLNVTGNLTLVNSTLDVDASTSQLEPKGLNVSGSISLTNLSQLSVNGVVMPLSNMTLNNSTATCSGAVTVPGELALTAGSLLTHQAATALATYKLDLVAGTVRVDATSKIDVSGRGYLGSLGSGTNGTTVGNTKVGGSLDNSGGSYGGLGGTCIGSYCSGGVANVQYGLLTDPNDLGSGGGGGSYSGAQRPGGNGGGLVRLKATQLILDGAIAADGLYGIGGGSGGGIRIDAGLVSGAGQIHANGGSVQDVLYPATWGGGGSGGRIAIYTDSILTTLSAITANGGAGKPVVNGNGAGTGGAGTVYTKRASSAGDLVIADGSGTQTTVPGGTYGTIRANNAILITTGDVTAESVELINTTMYATKLVAATISLASNSVLTHPATTATTTYSLDLTVSGVLSIDSTSKIDVNGRGYLGAGGEGPGTTLGNTTVGASTARSGASYGGTGGRCIDSYCGIANAPYGLMTDPNELGSGGGGGGYWGVSRPAGNGGGLVRINAGTMTLDGSISADGTNGIGGGSGGGIRIDASSLTGLGTIHANGGIAQDLVYPFAYGGGGGGGRIAIYTDSPLGIAAASITANGGLGQTPVTNTSAGPGGAGTVYLFPEPSSPISFVPVNGSTDVALDAVLRIYPIDPISFNASHISLVTQDGVSVPGTVTFENISTLVFKPAMVLKTGQAYIFTLSSGLRTVSGHLIHDQTLTFRTAENVSLSVLNQGTSTTPYLLTAGNYNTLDIRNSYVVLDGPVTATNLTLSSNSVLTHPVTTGSVINRLDLIVTGTLSIDLTSKIDASNRGFTAQMTLDTVTGLPTSVGGAGSYLGGSHGGVGGRSYITSVQTATYGNMQMPTTAGGGGSDNSGGGIVKVTAGSLQLVGNILANGGSISTYGGGAGGSILLTVGAMSGTGTIQANGGSIPDGYSSYGGGGGGRVAVYYTTNTLPTANITASGGSNTSGGVAYSGGAGTVYLKQSSSANGTINISSSSAGTTTYLAGGTYDSITLTNATVLASGPITVSTLTLSGSTLEASSVTAANLTLSSNSVLTHPVTTGSVINRLDLIVTGTLSIDLTSKIDVSNRGFTAQMTLDTVTGLPTSVGGAGSYLGGSHGGVGGRSYITSVQTATYGNMQMPTTAGGGGSDNSGGGIVKVTAGSLQLVGNILANGGSISTYGGGAGGSILLTVGAMSGTGTIQANGGSIPDGYSSYGGGGGGRVAVYYTTNTLPTANITASGGSNTSGGVAYSGGAGTVLISTIQQTLTISESGSGTVTSVPVGISCGATCSELFTTNSTVTLTATPSVGAAFTGWSGACTGTGTCSVTMSSAQNVTATFTVIPPPTVIITSPVGTIKNNQPTLTYSVSAGTVAVKVDGVVVSKVSGNTLDLLPDGPHTVRVEATNYGLTGFAENSFTIDTVAPTLTVNALSSIVRADSLSLSGAVEAGANLNVTATAGTASVGTPSFGSGTWSCSITNLSDGVNSFSITALDAAGNSTDVTASVTYVPPLAIGLSTSSIAANYLGALTVTVSDITPSGSTVLVEQFVDRNRNGTIEAGDYPLRSFTVTDGIAASSQNTAGDEDGAANGTTVTSLDYRMIEDVYHAPGSYIFRATLGAETAVAPLTVTAVGQSQSVSGLVTDGTNPVPGALVQLTDKWNRHVVWTTADDLGAYYVDVKQPGSYQLIAYAPGYVYSAAPVTVTSGQNIMNTTLAMIAGTYTVNGKVADATTTTGISGLWVQAKSASNTAVAITDASGNYSFTLPAGTYSVTALAGDHVPGTSARGYVGYDNLPATVSVSGTTVVPTIPLTAGTVQFTGTVKDSTGTAVPGVPVRAKIKNAVDVREPVSYSISKTDGSYSLGVFAGTGWDITLDNAVAQTLGYLGTSKLNLATAVGPLTGNDITVKPITAWIQGTVTDSTSAVLANVEVTLRNIDSSVTASVFTAADGTYRIGAYAGTWYLNVLYGIVAEQSATVTDGQTTTLNFVKDITPPVITITSPAAGLTNDNTPLLTFTVNEGTAVVKVDGTVVSKVSGNSLDALANGNHTVRVESTDAAGNLGFAEVALTVNYTAPSVSTASLPAGYLTTAYSQTLAATGGVAPFTWSYTGTLPAGLTLSTDGVISGTPTTAGTSSFTAKATDANLTVATKALSIVVYANPTVSTASLAGGTTGTAYSATLAATGGTTPYTWSYTGTLPAGLTLSNAGVISGTPTATGISSFTVQVSDVNAAVATKALSITVVAPLAISTPTLSDGYLTTAYSQTLAATGGTGSYTWSLNTGSVLPAGLSLSTAGVISGTPTTAGTSSVTFKVTDSASATATKAISIVVYALPTVSTASLPAGVTGTAYSQTLAATGGKTTYTWSSTGILPTGLTLSTAGVISGTPTAAGTFSFTVTVTDANGKTASKALSIVVANPALSVTTTALGDGYLTTAYSQTLAATGGTGSYTWSLNTGSKLPAGLTLSTTGAISGTPTAAGTTSVTFKVTDSASATATKAISIVVYALPTVSTASLPAGVTGTAYSQTLAATGGKTTYTWSSTGTLPTGVTMSTAGVISGTPTAAGTFSFTATVTDANGKAATKSLSIVITAQVALLNAWTNLYSSIPNNISATNLAVGNITAGSGTNRLLLVAVVMKIGTAANPTISASLGGTALTQIKVTNNTQKEIVWLGYLNESQIGSGSKALTISYSGATGNASALHVKWASFSGVNQTTPIASSGGLNTATTSATFGSTINYVLNGMTTVIAGNGGTPATGTLTATPAFTAGTATTTNTQTSNTYTSAKHTAAGSYTSTTPVTWTGTTGTMSGLVVVSLQP